jgi:hypothetical protein
VDLCLACSVDSLDTVASFHTLLLYVVGIAVTGYSLLASSWWPVLIESQSFSWSRMTFDSEHVVPAQQIHMTSLCLRSTGNSFQLAAYRIMRTG